MDKDFGNGYEIDYSTRYTDNRRSKMKPKQTYDKLHAAVKAAFYKLTVQNMSCFWRLNNHIEVTIMFIS
jgi:hypothetical protein